MAQAPTHDISDQTAGFGLAAAIAIVFNTVFAWVKDSYEPLNAAMKAAMGHHWITHGVVDVALFVILGMVLSNSGFAKTVNGVQLLKYLVIAVVAAGGGLAGWFLLV